LIKTALISVWDKSGLDEIVNFLSKNNVNIISTGGTQKYIESIGADVTPISAITGQSAVMDGRVKTLHPKIFGGILADRNNSNHMDDLNDLGGIPIDMVIVNFYPFVSEAVSKQLDLKKAIEYIDIGGPSMIRSAAKNYHSVIPLCDNSQFSEFIESYKENKGEIPLHTRQKWASEVFSMTSEYESSIYSYLTPEKKIIPKSISIKLNKSESLRYGENPHQSAGFYTEPQNELPWKQLQGKQLSYNNYADMDSAMQIINEFKKNGCVIIKHANPCGFGLSETTKGAYLKAVSTDPISYFGGIVGFNHKVNSDTANELIKSFLECIIAPEFSNEALEIFKQKKNLRIVILKRNDVKDFNIKSVAGGYLYQSSDYFDEVVKNCEIVTNKKPTELELKALDMGWKLVRFVKSNGIVIANSEQLIGVGAGQMSRIDSVKIAIRKAVDAGLNLGGAILASDAFFPFSDSIELAVKYGISSIIQPGGSIKDRDVINKANKLGISMVLTGKRHFFH
jgi:phosphoribosylaminoimidazolecarboxamide formyltransferase / IMP cyclohydrolase